MAKKEYTLVTVKQYAAHFGVSIWSVYYWIRKKMIQTVPYWDEHIKGMEWAIIWPQRRPKKTVGRPPLYPAPHEKLPPYRKSTRKTGCMKVSNEGGPEK